MDVRKRNDPEHKTAKNSYSWSYHGPTSGDTCHGGSHLTNQNGIGRPSHPMFYLKLEKQRISSKSLPSWRLSAQGSSFSGILCSVGIIHVLGQ